MDYDDHAQKKAIVTTRLIEQEHIPAANIKIVCGKPARSNHKWLSILIYIMAETFTGGLVTYVVSEQIKLANLYVFTSHKTD